MQGTDAAQGRNGFGDQWFRRKPEWRGDWLGSTLRDAFGVLQTLIIEQAARRIRQHPVGFDHFLERGCSL
jgi:hypothetical protein